MGGADEPETHLNYVGYARVSTDDQCLDLQLNALRKFGVPDEHIFCEYQSGKTLKRPAFTKALKYLRKGDTFVVWKFDRLGRNTAEVSAFALQLEAWGVKLKSLTEGIDTSTAAGRMMFRSMASFAEYERDMIVERTKAGIEAAKERGTWRKRPPTITREQWAFMLITVAQNPMISSNALSKHPAMPRRDKAPYTPKRTTLNNYMPLLRDGEPYPFDDR